jgi:hypothetical protein
MKNIKGIVSIKKKRIRSMDEAFDRFKECSFDSANGFDDPNLNPEQRQEWNDFLTYLDSLSIPDSAEFWERLGAYITKNKIKNSFKEHWHWLNHDW